MCFNANRSIPRKAVKEFLNLGQTRFQVAQNALRTFLLRFEISPALHLGILRRFIGIVHACETGELPAPAPFCKAPSRPGVHKLRAAR